MVTRGVTFMKSAAVSKLKATLSQCLARVKAGEELIVTEHGKPIAKIVPLRRDPGEIRPHLRELARAGLIRLGTGKLPAGFWKMPRPADPRGAVLKALLDERESGR
jgi:prevent-host-death family protein